MLRGKNIHRYYAEIPDQWVLYIPWHFPLHDDETIKGVSALAEFAFNNEYPSVYNYLLTHKEALENRNKAETGIRYEWFALQRFGSNYWKDFMKKKIVWGNLALRGSYALVDEGVYINAPSAFIPTDNLFLLAILNSKLADFYIKRLGVTRNGGYFEYKPMFVEQLPVPQVSQSIQDQFIAKVEKLLDKTVVNKSGVEDEIDDMVCLLYDITAEEKQAIYRDALVINSISLGESSNIL
nr:TaqI-like C-terminal specificity domain-containing protein [Mucilaginibacter sp. E4BP6]